MKRRQTRPSLGHRSPQLRMDQASPITPLAFYRGKSPKKLNGYIFVVKRARAGPGPGPARPGPQWGYPPRGSEGSRSPHCHKPGSTSSEQFTWPPAWFVTVPWTGTSRSQMGVPPRMSTFLIWQAHSKNPTSLYSKGPLEEVQECFVWGTDLRSAKHT